MGLLTQLTYLSLAYNSLSGSIPTEMGLLTKLTVLGLDTNSLSGTIPTEMGLLTQLIDLYLFTNSLSGTIPTEMGLLTKLAYLYLYTNSLSGSIPTEMGLLTQLGNLDLSSNSLCGPVPPTLLTECPLDSCLIGYNGTATCKPSPIPTTSPSIAPSARPSADPSIAPSARPSAVPSFRPSNLTISISIPTSSGDNKTENTTTVIIAVVVSVVAVIALFIAAIFAYCYKKKEENTQTGDVEIPSRGEPSPAPDTKNPPSSEVKFFVDGHKVDIQNVFTISRVLFGSFSYLAPGGKCISLQVVIKLPIEGVSLSREAEFYKQIAREESSPLVPIFYAYNQNPEYLIIQKFGSDLAEFLKNLESRDSDYLIGIIRELLLAVQFLHNKGFIHTDIKPANVLVDTSHGIAVKLCDLDSVTKLNDKVTAGTLGWHAPEVYLKKNVKATEKVDVFPVGLIAALLFHSKRNAFRIILLTTDDVTLREIYTDQAKLNKYLPCLGTTHYGDFIRQSMCNIDPSKRVSMAEAIRQFDTTRSILMNYRDEAETELTEAKATNKFLQQDVVGNFKKMDEKIDKLDEKMDDMINTFESSLSKCATDVDIKQLVSTFINSVEFKTGGEATIIREPADTELLRKYIYDLLQSSMESQSKSIEELKNDVSTKFKQVTSSLDNIEKSVDNLSVSVRDFGDHLIETINSKHRTVIGLIKQMHSETKLNSLLGGTQGIPTLMVAIPEVSSSIKSYLKKPSKIFVNDVRIFFICPYSLRLMLSGQDGKGFLFKQVKDWVKVAAPVLKVGLSLIQIGLVAGAGIRLPIADLIPHYENLNQQLQYFQAIKEVYNDSYLPDMLNSSVPELTNASIEKMMTAAKSKDNRDAYFAVRDAFNKQGIDEKALIAYSGLKPVLCDNDEIAWIDENLVEKFEDNGRKLAGFRK